MKPFKITVTYDYYYLFTSYLERKSLQPPQEIKKHVYAALLFLIVKEISKKNPGPCLMDLDKKKKYPIKLSPAHALGLYVFLSLELALNNVTEPFAYLVVKHFHDALDRYATNFNPQTQVNQIANGNDS